MIKVGSDCKITDTTPKYTPQSGLNFSPTCSLKVFITPLLDRISAISYICIFTIKVGYEGVLSF